ncbi:MAG: hypothetical protein IPO15_13525 [Anaerolineae bacterium]|uniref:hypothetical protein n=1 Tax=Candidatus Amarolinea dominans TaxID=3140696 RepID=UPI003134B700|nr:hypothetical protein [Anaerolineae bacterium]
MANNTLLHKLVLGMTTFINPTAPSQSRLYFDARSRAMEPARALPPTSYTYGSGTTDGHMVTVNNGYQGRVEITYGGSSGGMVVQQEWWQRGRERSRHRDAIRVRQ